MLLIVNAVIRTTTVITTMLYTASSPMIIVGCRRSAIGGNHCTALRPFIILKKRGQDGGGRGRLILYSIQHLKIIRPIIIIIAISVLRYIIISLAY